MGTAEDPTPRATAPAAKSDPELHANEIVFLAFKLWCKTLPENYFTTNPRSDSDMFQDFGSFLVENKRHIAAGIRYSHAD